MAGITAPAFNKYKMKNMQNDCELVAKKNNISFKWNSKFPINSLNIMRGYLCVKDNKKEENKNMEYVEPGNLDKFARKMNFGKYSFFPIRVKKPRCPCDRQQNCSFSSMRAPINLIE